MTATATRGQSPSPYLLLYHSVFSLVVGAEGLEPTTPSL